MSDISIMAVAAASPAWQPAIALDAKTVSAQAFAEALEKFWTAVKKRIANRSAPPNPFDHDGWYDITPEMAEIGLMYTGGNREISLPGIRTAVFDIDSGDWAETGESICFSDGKLWQGHHRLLSVLLSGKTIRNYVVTSAPPRKNLFAYYDQHVRRKGSHALQVAGWNGAGRIIAKAIEHIAVRYDHDALGIQKQVRFRPVSPRETLVYLETHPDFEKAAQLMLASYSDAADVIRSKAAAVFFAWKVIDAHDTATLEEFCVALGSGANLDEDSPILAARNKLTAAEAPGRKMADRTRLAYVSKAFIMWNCKQKMPRSRGGKIAPLNLDLDEDFPRIVRDPLANAAE